MLSVIGIHSGLHQIPGQPNLLRNIGDGHAWLTLHYLNGASESVGLWPAGARTVGLPPDQRLQFRMVVRDPVGFLPDSEETFDVVFGLEKKYHYLALASRYYGLYSNQSSKAIMALGQYTGWRITNNCATWATEKIVEIFGARLASEEFHFVNTPRALQIAIQKLEARDPTAVNRPKYMK